ncbi:hypothetical protein A1QW_07830 [Vibrio anguillarum]|nr:hypothetical protein A1QW_07830 [Vibrio anguillarum]OEF92161.1 hypothetical protein A1QY_15395 [Vibrio anguillarum]
MVKIKFKKIIFLLTFFCTMALYLFFNYFKNQYMDNSEELIISFDLMTHNSDKSNGYENNVYGILNIDNLGEENYLINITVGDRVPIHTFILSTQALRIRSFEKKTIKLFKNSDDPSTLNIIEIKTIGLKYGSEKHYLISV